MAVTFVAMVAAIERCDDGIIGSLFIHTIFAAQCNGLEGRPHGNTIELDQSKRKLDASCTELDISDRDDYLSIFVLIQSCGSSRSVRFVMTGFLFARVNHYFGLRLLT